MTLLTIHNVEKDEVIQREMTESELEQRKLDVVAEQERVKNELQKLSAKKTLLEKLGITEDEAKLLLS